MPLAEAEAVEQWPKRNVMPVGTYRYAAPPAPGRCFLDELWQVLYFTEPPNTTSGLLRDATKNIANPRHVYIVYINTYRNTEGMFCTRRARCIYICSSTILSEHRRLRLVG